MTTSITTRDQAKARAREIRAEAAAAGYDCSGERAGNVYLAIPPHWNASRPSLATETGTRPPRASRTRRKFRCRSATASAGRT